MKPIEAVEALTLLFILAMVLAVLTIVPGCGNLADAIADEIPMCVESDTFGCPSGEFCFSDRCERLCDDGNDCPSGCCKGVEGYPDVSICAPADKC